MPTIGTSRLPAPTSWDEFEDICKSAFSLRWGNPNLSRYGRQGQKQDGVDVFGNDSLNNFVGIQCKNTISSISKDLVESECLKAENFLPPISVLYIATTMDRDVNLQSDARIMSDERKLLGKFTIEIVFWPDIIHDLSKDASITQQHYPQYFNVRTPSHRELKRNKDISSITSLINVIDFNSTFEHLSWGAKYIHVSIIEQLSNIQVERTAPTFSLDNQALLEETDLLINEWSELVVCINKAPYKLHPNSYQLCFYMPGDHCRNQEENHLYEQIDAKMLRLMSAMKSICSLINSEYHEINLNSISKNARYLY